MRNYKRSLLVTVGTIMLLAIGFAAGRFLNTAAAEQAAAPVLASLGLEDAQSAAAAAPTTGEVIVLDNGSGPVRITFTNAPELPATPAVTGGLFLRRQDNSLFVGTGSIEVNIEVVNGETTVAGSNDGPEVEVVITNDTVIYEDITDTPIIGEADVTAGEMVVQRQVRLVDNLDELSENMTVRVWGERSGDRIVATVIYYDNLGL